jgi:anaerobic magnesium-protoporphyrin IX monomethyl ester cyclase
MTPRLVLASSPVSIEERYGDFAGAGSTEPSFGLLCLASAARQAGAAVAVVEASARNLDLPAALRDVLAFNPDVVGVTATTSEIVRAAELAAQVKQARPAILTIIGGCHVTALPEETLQAFPAFDLAVVGEGEETLAEILRARARGERAPATIAGTVTREGDALKKQAPRPLIANLDALPLPAWDLLEGFPRLYRPSPGRIKRWPCASIVLTRGCPNRCVFCDRSVFGNRCRAYSPSYALDLVRDLYTNHGVRELLIEDDTFVISKERVREFCERLIDEKLALSWSCLGRADRVNPELLGLMRRAGCWHISYGIESGDPDILKAMHKHLDVEQIRQALTWSRESGMRTKGFFIVGFPGETPASLARTKAFACSLPLDDISVMQMTPFPGSELYGMADQYGSFTRDWRKMNVLNTVFVPHGFTRADLEQARNDILKAFYLRPGVIWRQGLHALRHPSLIPGVLGGFRAFRKAIRDT